MYLFGDTETTGFPKNGSLTQDGQARVCQSAFILTDEVGNSLSEVCMLHKPDGWIISEGAYNTHGKTMDMCERYGFKAYTPFSAFCFLAKRAELLMFHNVKFDWKMMQIEAAHLKLDMPNIKTYCTMENSTNLCKIPHPRGRGFKWPSVKEALRILCDKELRDEDAHDAMADTRACKDVFFALKERGRV